MYVFEEQDVQALKKVMHRLYSEQRFRVDEMRDLAQFMDAILDKGVMVDEKELGI